MVYFICGHKGCGKTYLVNQISENVNCHVIDTGPLLRQKYKESNSNITFSEWLNLGEKQYGEYFTNMIICENIYFDFDITNIIIGNRSINGIKYIVDYFDIKDFKIVYIDGNFELFRYNYNIREEKKINIHEFGKLIEIENNMGIDQIKQYVIYNGDNNLYFYKEKNDNEILDKLLADIKDNQNIKKRRKLL